MKKLLITLPCYNEELILEKNIKPILAYAQKNLSDYDWKVMVLDNASSDKTYEIGKKLADQDPRILVDQEVKKGRGAALSAAWLKHAGFDRYAYMDIDLATDLKDFKSLLTGVEEGHHFTVGSRYTPGADIERSANREFLSRIYNFLLQTLFRVSFKDAQCGFKAYHADVVKNVLPHVQDPGWFWDTEFMIRGERAGYKVKEVPVSWREIRDELRQSKVSPFQEVVRQLKNIILLRARL